MLYTFDKKRKHYGYSLLKLKRQHIRNRSLQKTFQNEKDMSFTKKFKIFKGNGS